MGVLEEQRATSYHTGQIWNREKKQPEIEINPYISLRCKQNWAAVNESVDFEIRRRFSKLEKGKRKKTELAVQVLASGKTSYSTTEVIIPAGAEQVVVSLDTNDAGFVGLQLLPDLDQLKPRYIPKYDEDGDACPVLNLTPYEVEVFDGVVYAYLNIYRTRYVLGFIDICNDHRPWDDPFELRTCNPNERVLTTRSWPLGPDTETRSTNRYSGNPVIFESAEQVSTIYAIYVEGVAYPNPSADLALLRWLGVQSSYFGTPLPLPMPDPYVFETFGDPYDYNLYPAPPIMGGATSWVYSKGGHYSEAVGSSSMKTITPPPPNTPKIKGLWTEDPQFVL